MSGSDTAAAEQVAFAGGPPDTILSWLGILREKRPRFALRAGLVVALGWLPLVALSVAHGDFFRAGTDAGFLADFGAQARFLIAAPILILAESVCLPRLAAIAGEFVRTGVLASADYPSYERAIGSTRRLMNSTFMAGIAVALAYLLAGSVSLTYLGKDLPAWHGSMVGKAFIISPAGWWGLFVSLPLLLILLIGWFWRVCLWTRFLWLMARTNLHLIPAHPDRAAGLRFVGASLRAFQSVAFVFGVLVAGPIMNLVVHQGALLEHFKLAIASTAIFAVAVFVSPLLVFLGRLMQEQRRGLSLYGGLAAAMGREFEKKWFKPEEHLDKSALAASDFSATTDLYSIVSNVYAMRLLPLELRNVLLIVAATWLPFLPVALLSVPLDVIIKRVAGLLI